MFLYSTAFKNHVASVGSIKDAFDGGFIKIYTAPTAIPASADAAIPNDSTLILTYSVDGLGTGLELDTAAANGVISKPASALWKGAAVASTDGVTPLFFRYERTGDSGAASTTDLRIQGSVGLGASDLVVTSTTFVTGQEYVLDFFSISLEGC